MAISAATLSRNVLLIVFLIITRHIESIILGGFPLFEKRVL